ncbi:MAG: malto-oligosyltrehalose trehalohydrolase [Planctomycetaceae bacterium]|nr:malto-oligosyltrehalose trehalohydrolase [Planctomycetaceae bacterium]
MPHRIVQRPVGATRQPDGSVLWRVWTPKASAVSLVIEDDNDRREFAMSPENDGHFVHRATVNAVETLRYGYRPGGDRAYPDPASRWQPDGVHAPSALFFPESYSWVDASWTGVAREDLVIYELHVGTFTPEGTFAAIIPRLPELKRLGVTAIELMPVAQFPGDRGWGYDGAYPYAAQQSYGGPQALQQLIDAAHAVGLGVILDVVYNHFGPEGNYSEQFGPYFTDRYRTPWGRAINFDGPYCDPVRRFFIDNACYWVRDFHLDGLRLDAVQTIYDFSPRHILADIQAAVQCVAREQQRTVVVIAETDQNDVRLVQPIGRGGYALDGVWADDFHHSIHALLTGERDGYYEDYGRPEQLAKASRDVFVYDGVYSSHRHRRHGTRVGRADRSHFVVCTQNHDQIGNRARGDRLASLVPPPAERLAFGLMLLSPCVPLLFMGEEYGERRPFPFFCSFGDPELVDAVRRGRLEEFAALRFRWSVEIPDPQSAETFASAKIVWSWPDGSSQAARRRLTADLLAARRQWPALQNRDRASARLLGNDQQRKTPVLLVARGGVDGLVVVANLSAEVGDVPISDRELLLSTEDARYGGSRGETDSWNRLLPHELLVFGHRGNDPKGPPWTRQNWPNS